MTDQDHTITAAEISQAAAEFKSAIVDADTLFLEDVDGRKEFLVFDDDRVKLTVYSDLTNLQESNKALYNNPVDHKSEFRLKARIPTAFLDIYGAAKGLPSLWYYEKQFNDVLVRIANDPDYRDFRTSPGQL